MAKLYADSNGICLRYLKTPDEEERFPDPPEGTADTVVFDPGTNPTIATALDSDWNNCRLQGGVFSYKGNPVTIRAGARSFTDREALAAIWAKLRADGSISAAELRVLLRFILRHLGQRDG